MPSGHDGFISKECLSTTTSTSTTYGFAWLVGFGSDETVEANLLKILKSEHVEIIRMWFIIEKHIL
jgi:hypothetical protein